MRTLPLLLLPALVLTAGTGQRHRRTGGPVSTAKEAKRIAEQETGGKAVSANRIPLNGASAGWEVDVHMPKDSRGWRCVIDADTHMVHTKSRIDNPALKHR
ncbi:MAG TPA: PepSY domain-containing protein [Holophagaceae bacterium]|nr:PepSY domain-containing protein [Holophagaceae bacterium]